MTQEFYISVTPVRDGEYLVRTERVAMGVPLAEELVHWDVDHWLSQAVQVMHDPLVGLLRGKRSGSTSTAPEAERYDLVSLGQALYDAIFQGTIRDSWMIAQGVAQNQKEILRLRLGLKDERLPLLPWEVLHDGARPIATNTDVVFSRYRSTTNRTANAAEWRCEPNNEQPLRILMVLAAPTDQEVLQLQQEAEQLQQELQRETPSSKQPNLELAILNQPGREQLTQALEHEHYDILHYAGHSDLSASGGDLYLVSEKTGLTEVLSGDDLAGLLVNNGVRMVVFNSCQGVYSASASENGSSSGSLADALLKRNVPAVLAMAEQIPDDVALNLSRLFYRNLKQRSAIDLSIARARQGLLSSYGSDQLYWALPILYMHAEFDGYLQAHPQPLQLASEDWEKDLGPGDWIPEDLPDANWPGQAEQDQATIDGLLKELADNATTTTPPKPQLMDASDFHRLGQKLAAESDTAGALEAFGNAINLNPEFAAAYNDLGQVFEQDGSLSEAMTSYKMALRYQPEFSEAENNLRNLTEKILDLPREEKDADRPSADADKPSESLIDQVKPKQNQSSSHPSQPTPTPPKDRIFAPTTTQKPKPNALTNGKTLAMAAASVVVLGSVWFLASRPPSQSPDQPLSQAEITAQTNNKELTAISAQSFAQKDLKKGSEAVAQLLEQGALIEAQTALAAVAPRDLQTPIISYLRGRLAWETLKQGRKTTYEYGDARRYWNTAVKEQPNNHNYRTTLGFGFYAERNWKAAEQTWKEAIKRLDNSKASSTDPDRLTAYAGRALALAKQAREAGKNDQKQMAEALKIRDQVVRLNTGEFLPENLATNDWRWTAQMLADWGNLLSEKS
ncbi:CHAT domain-containing protein [filamentous cyanobacterium LEGE 11480]|uniref:CHAT domain-containing protein n=1 Tax=Romeriopsis navalis LEGE 11480 TaxID=2777977 RepID=A0A928Z220_9CYAN|nr:CHAT domain-containing protein [Romeriopsis navalis]MBE9029941.1 CHAT domain-containing protein [Romeriopsis navalis LEGE 11480]